MPSLLLITVDIRVVNKISEIAHCMELRIRELSDIQLAEEWLSMQTYDAMLVDSRIAENEVSKILNLAWKHNPNLIGGVFNPSGEVEYLWDIRLLGAHVFHGPSMYKDIEQMLESLPRPYLFDENNRRAVLFVEDLDSPRDIIGAYIESLGYSNVKAVANAKEALTALTKAPDDYFCVLTDIKMPGTSGIELTQEIRNNEAIRHLPVIVLTAVPTTENLIGALRAGVTGFLVKPPRKNILRKELEKAKRIFVSKASPALCVGEEVSLVEDALEKAALYQELLGDVEQ